MDALRYNRLSVSMSASAVSSQGVDMAGCSQPTTGTTACTSQLVQVISSGTDTFTYDYNLLPFTGTACVYCMCICDSFDISFIRTFLMAHFEVFGSICI